MAYLSAMSTRSHGGLWLKTQARGPSASLPCRPGMMMLGAEEEKESSVTLGKKRGNIISVITYFHEIIRIHMSVETCTYHRDNSPYGTLMDGWRKTEDRIVKSQSIVILE